jgi:hypothetical protein
MTGPSSARLLLLCGLLVSGCSAPLVTKNEVPFSFALRKPNVVLHEPLYLQLTVDNGLSEKVTFDLGSNRKGNIRLVITEPGNSTVTASHLREGGLLRIGDVLLEPGATYKQDVLVNEWYQFSKPGRYQIQANVVNLALKRQSSALLSSKTISTLALKAASDILISNQSLSTPMALEIDPPDPIRLAGICQSLLQTALTSPSPAQQGEAAFALSYVQDVVAVPYLTPLAKIPFLKQSAFLGLARIADAEGLDKVISKLGTKDPQLEQGIRIFLPCIRVGCPSAD